MELVLSIVSIVVCILLFLKERENPIFAIIPFLNFYILSRIAGATWAFWGYMAGCIGYIFAIMSEIAALANISNIAMLVMTFIVYIRIVLGSKNDRVLAIVLLVCEVLRMFVF